MVITFNTKSEAVNACLELYNTGMYKSNLTIQYTAGRGYDLVISHEDDTRDDFATSENEAEWLNWV